MTWENRVLTSSVQYKSWSIKYKSCFPYNFSAVLLIFFAIKCLTTIKISNAIIPNNTNRMIWFVANHNVGPITTDIVITAPNTGITSFNKNIITSIVILFLQWYPVILSLFRFTLLPTSYIIISLFWKPLHNNKPIRLVSLSNQFTIKWFYLSSILFDAKHPESSLQKSIPSSTVSLFDTSKLSIYYNR